MQVRAEQIIGAYDQLRSSRSNVDNTYRDIEELVLPAYQGSNTDRRKAKGQSDRPVSSVATDAAFLLGSNLFSYTYSNSERNFSLRASDKRDEDQMKVWLQIATDKATKYIQASNFSSVYGDYCKTLSTFGTAIATTEFNQDRKELIFNHIPVTSNVYVNEGENGVVDSIFRLLKLTAREALKLFGEDNLNSEVKEALTDLSKINEKFDYILSVTPNPDHDPEKMDILSAKYTSEYVDVKEKKIVKKSGYRTFPYAVARFIKSFDGSAYGLGSGHTALPAIQELNKAEKQLIDSLQMAAHPPIFVHDDDETEIDEIAPNTVIYTDLTKGQPTQLRIGGDPTVIMERIKQLTEQINRSFFSNVFLAVMHSQNTNKTATEIEELSSEKFASVGPIIARLRTEFWSPMIERVIDLLVDAGEIPQPPVEFFGKDYNIDYISQIDTRLELLDGQKTLLALQGANQILAAAEANPALKRVFKAEQAAVDYLKAHNIDMDHVVSDAERDDMDQAEAQMQEFMQQKQNAETALDKIGQVDPNKAPEEGSIAEAVSEEGSELL